MAQDPNWLFNTITSLMVFLFDREEANLVKREEALIEKNMFLSPGSSDGFRYMGIIYSRLQGNARRLGKFPSLHHSLTGEMGTIDTERKVIQADKARIKQALTLVLRNVHSFQDMRDALPNCMKDLVAGCRGLERTRPEAYTLADNRLSYTQYMAIREKIEFYTATRLLY